MRWLQCWSTVEFVTNYGTLPSRFLNAIDQLPNPRAQMFRRGNGWQAISSEEFLRRVAGLSAALVELGVKTGDRVGIFCANRPEWHTADFAITGAGGVSVPIYFNESPQRMAYILNHSEARVRICLRSEPAAEITGLPPQLLSVEHIIAADAGGELPAECLRYETLIAGAGRRRCLRVPDARVAGCA